MPMLLVTPRMQKERIEPWRVLLVDDEDDVRISLADLLETRDEMIQVTHVPNGQEALERLRGERFDMLVTDFRMPGPDGIEVMTRARAMHPTMPAILMSAYEDSEAKFLALDDKFQMRFFEKPLDPEAFVDTVRRGLQTGFK